MAVTSQRHSWLMRAGLWTIGVQHQTLWQMLSEVGVEWKEHSLGVKHIVPICGPPTLSAKQLSISHKSQGSTILKVRGV